MPGNLSIDSSHSAELRPGISVLIRTYNSAATLVDVLKKLPLEEHDELIVVDSGSTDSTCSIAHTYHAQIIELDRPFNYSAALNRGFEEAANDWVLVISSHSIPQSLSLVEIVRNFATRAPVDFVVGYGICDVASLVDSVRQELRNQPSENEFRGLQVSEIGGNGLAVYRRSAWLQHKFSEHVVTAEDLEWFIWAQSLGYKAARISGANAIYRNQGSLAHMFRKGWNEVKQAQILLPRPPESITKICHGWILGSLHLLKLTVTRQLPLGSMLRQQSHLLSAFLARLLTR
jgi:glycosyltransferase involved in cell wall biosynthesis